MSKFRKTITAIDEVHAQLEENAAAFENAVQSEESLERAKDEALRLSIVVDEIGADLATFVATAKIKDEDKKVYGPGMTKRVLEQDSRFAEVLELSNQTKAKYEEAYRHIAERKAREIAAKEEAARLEREARAAEERAAREKREATRIAIREAEEAARIARETKEREEEIQKREAFEQQRTAQEVLAAALGEEERKRVEERRRRFEEAEDLTIEETLEALESSLSRSDYKRAVIALHGLMDNIQRNPSDKRFRQLRQANAALKADLTRHPGGEECLISLGFQEADISTGPDGKTMEPVFRMEEPDLDELEEWTEWFDDIKDSLNFLTSALEECRQLD